MKTNADRLARAENRKLRIGDIVIVRQEKKNQLSARFDPKPYTVTHKKGTMITAGSPHFSEREIQGLFQEFQGPMNWKSPSKSTTPQP